MPIELYRDPQHGVPDLGGRLPLSIDLFDDRAYQVPTTRIDPRIHRTDMA